MPLRICNIIIEVRFVPIADITRLIEMNVSAS